VLVSDDAPPVLLDFGAARRVISDRNQNLTAILKPSCAPIEQYAESTGMRQGPWTDFYALGATLHFLITGKAPMPATARAVSDEQPRLAGSGQGGVPDLLLQVCDWMLAPAPQERPQNVAELRAALVGQLPVPQRARRSSANSWQTTVVQMADGEPGASAFGPSELPVPRAQAQRRARARTIWAAAAAMVMVTAVGAWWASAPSAGPSANAPFALTSGTGASAGAADAADRAKPALEPVGDRVAANVPPAPDKPESARANTPAVAAVKPRPPTAARLDSAAARQAKPAAKPKATPARATDNHAAAPANVEPAAAVVPTAATSDTAPGQPPVSVATVTRNPRERCGGRHLLAMHRCLVRECEKPEHTAHRECQRVRDIETRTRTLHGSN
jgi:hypothetical protein